MYIYILIYIYIYVYIYIYIYIYVYIYIYISYLVSFKKFSRSSNGDIFLLVLGVSNTFGLGATLVASLV